MKKQEKTRKSSLVKRLPIRVVILGSILFFAVFLAVWLPYVAPAILRLPSTFSYKADVVSYDDFYDPATSSYTGPVRSNTTFSYKTTKSDANLDTIANTFDVRKPDGEQIFSVTRSYGINRTTTQHVPGYGDKDRDGYLFAPRNLHKQGFDYWHINYDTPAHMKFQDEETLVGVRVYRYEAKFTADQTKELTNLPGVGKSRGVSLDVHLRLWVEPTSGHLVKYEDDTIAYYYRLTDGQRIHPWNHFNNRYSFTSVAAQARVAEEARQRIQLVEIVVPVAVSILLAIGCVILCIKKRARLNQVSVLATTSAFLAVASLLFWYTFGLTLGLPEWLEPMYPGASVGVLALSSIVLLLLNRKDVVHTYGRGMGVIFIMLSTIAFAIAAGHLWNWDVSEFEIVVRGGKEPVILFIAALVIGLYSLALGIELGVEAKQRPLARLQEFLVSFGVGLSLACTIAYAYGQNGPVLEWLQAARLPAAVALFALGLAIFTLHPEWVLSRRLRRLGKGAWLFVAVLVGLIVVTGLAWQTTRATTVQQSQLQFQSDINTLQNAISDRLRIYSNALYGGQGLFAASNAVERDEWKAYAESLHLGENYPGMQGFGFAQIIPKDQIATHEAQIRSQGFPKYSVHPLSPSRNVYSSIVYLEPFDERNQRAFGFDMLSESTRRAALNRAAATGSAAMTGRVVLLQETDTDVQYGFLIYVPVYKNGMPTLTESDRQKALVGYVYSPFRMNNFAQAITGNLANGIDIEIFDTADPARVAPENAMFMTSTSIDEKSHFREIQTVTAAGHTWSVRYTGSNDYANGIDQSLPTFVLYGGLVLSFALAAAVFALSTSRQRALLYADRATVELVREKNRALSVEQKDETILSGINEGLIVFDQTGAIERVNQAACKMLGYTQTELVGEHYSDILYALDDEGRPLAEGRRPALKALRNGRASDTTLQYVRKDRSTFVANVSIAPLLARKNVIGAIEIFRDVTEEHELDVAKDEFLSLASHQLRTPLTAKRWDIELLLGGDVSEKLTRKQYEIASRINKSNDRMIKLVNELLNVSRAESGRLAVTPQKTEVSKLIQSVVDDIKPKLVEKEQKVQLSIDSLPELSIDPILIRQAFLNLLTNASKYSPKKTTITIKGKVHGAFVEFSVKDQGYGVPKSQQDKLFTKFFRADNISNKETDGNGLGLYLVKSIVEVSGGKVWFESQENRGSTFYLTLPLKGSKLKKGQVSLS